MIRISCQQYYSNKFNTYKNNIKNTWKIINELLGKNKNKDKPAPYFLENNNKITDLEEIANEDVGTKLSSKISQPLKTFSDFLSRPNDKSIFFSPITTKETIEILSELKSGKSTGYDDINAGVIKQVAPFIVHPLCHIFNFSFSTGVFPTALKIAKIIPILKKDDRHIICNYRPMSLLPCFSKVLEKLYL